MTVSKEKMKIGITGSDGFIGKNLLERLSRIKDLEVLTFTKKSSLSDLEFLVRNVSVIFHLAGVNRSHDDNEFISVNKNLTQIIVGLIEKHKAKTTIVYTSSIHVNKDDIYGVSKLEGEVILKRYANRSQSKVYIYRLPNIFGKWSRPNYNTVIATWCYNISRDLPVLVHDKNKRLDLIYIDDLINNFITHIDKNIESGVLYPEIIPVYKKKIGDIYDLLISFKDIRSNSLIPSVGSGFSRALYATYLSFLPTNKFIYNIEVFNDDRGSFYEVIKTQDNGQVSISTTAPGVTRGNHYHNTKNEKFIVIKGEAIISLRHIYSDERIDHKVSGENLQVVEIIPGYTHCITNTGDCDMILLLWSNEIYNQNKSDTYAMEV